MFDRVDRRERVPSPLNHRAMLACVLFGGHKKDRASSSKKPLQLPSFSKLACEQKFEQISEILLDESVPHISWLFSDNCRADFPMQLFQQQQLPLHTLLKHRPPVNVVELLLATLKDHVSVERNDMLGRTPLHTAVQHGCSVDVIELLITHSMGGILGLTRDFWGRSPLHWAVAVKEPRSSLTHKLSKWMSGNMKQRVNNMMESLETRVMTVYALVQACPEMVYIRDEDGRTPLDLAVETNADRSLQYLLLPSMNGGERSVGTSFVGTSFAGSSSEEEDRSVWDTEKKNKAETESDPATTASTVFEMTVECSSAEDDDNDASSIGSGGISKFVCPCPRSKVDSTTSLLPPPPPMMMMQLPGHLQLK